ncbi:MAG: hypothetical protein PHS02_03605 [Candidatus ainarchaeum sp.]|nr:hypothetical protein [Candidatus ainarchaeum sp.]
MLEQSMPKRSNASEFIKFANINFPPECDFACPQCCQYKPREKSSESGAKEYVKFSEQYLKFLRLCNSLGARTFAVMGEGEPLLHMDMLRTCIEKAHGLGMFTIIFTNGSKIDREKVAFFKIHDVSLVFNTPSLYPETYAQLVGRKYSLEKIIGKLRLVLEIYGEDAMRKCGEYRVGRVATNTVVNARNKAEIPLMEDRLKALLGPLSKRIIKVINFPLKMGRAALDENKAIFAGRYENEYLEFMELARKYSDLHGPTALFAGKCGYLTQGATIGYEGSIIPCPYATAMTGRFGHIHEIDDANALKEAILKVSESWAKLRGYCLMRAFQNEL